MRSRSLLVLLVLLVTRLALAQERAPGPGATPAGSADRLASDPLLLAFLEPQRDDLGRRCVIEAVVTIGELCYVACGEAGIWIVRVAPSGGFSMIERRELDGSATGLFARDGYLWVEISRVQARRLAPTENQVARAQPSPVGLANPGSRQPAPNPSLEAHAAMARRAAALETELRAKALGRVIAVEPGAVIVDLGSRDAVDSGDHIAFYESVREDLGGDQGAVRRHQLAVGKAVSIAPNRTRVALGLDERVPLRSFAELTGEPLTVSSLAPPRAAGLWEVAFVARPFMVIDNLGAGVFVDGRTGYRAEGGLHLEALLEPIAIASAHQGGSVPFAALASAGYDAKLFEVSLGLGGQSLYQPSTQVQSGTGITIAQRLRLGARDGLMIEAWSYVALFHSQFTFSNLRVQGQIPLSDTSWLLLGGGGGLLGLGYGEVGLRLLLVGNGDRGSFFLRTAIGGVNVFKSWPCEFNPINGFQSCKPPINYSGPMIGAGGEWRL